MTDCLKCLEFKAGAWQCYATTKETGEQWFDVTLAMKLVADREPRPVRPDQMIQLLTINEFNSAHIDHVDPDKPGIVAFTDDKGTGFLIDGIHRLARCVRDKRQFFVRVIEHTEVSKIRIPNPEDFGACTLDDLLKFAEGRWDGDGTEKPMTKEAQLDWILRQIEGGTRV